MSDLETPAPGQGTGPVTSHLHVSKALPAGQASVMEQSRNPRAKLLRPAGSPTGLREPPYNTHGQVGRTLSLLGGRVRRQARARRNRIPKSTTSSGRASDTGASVLVVARRTSMSDSLCRP
jgi:hypothetical protein